MNASFRLGLLQLLTPFLAIGFGALVASGIILAIGQNPLDVYGLMVRFSLTRSDSIAAILFKATPLIFAGLAVALSFRANVWNIGVEGQYYVGAFAAAWVGFTVRGLPGVLHLVLAVLAGALAGALWALPPIGLKLRRGAHEVITTIMMNYIAGALVLYLLADVYRDPAQAGTPRVRTPEFPPGARPPLLRPLLEAVGLSIPEHSALNAFLLVGIVLCLTAAVVLARSRFGFEVRATAQNPMAAEAAGIRLGRTQLLMFLASGAVAGLIGLSDVLGFFGYFDIDFPKGLGFLGISVALLARNHPIGVIPAALLFGFLDRGAQGVQVFADVPREVITILQAIIILAIVVAYELLTRYVRVQRKREAERLVAGLVAAPAGAKPAGEGGEAIDLLLSLLSMALLASAVRLTVPILLTAIGAVYSERGGVFNIGLEGIMIMGTFFGAAMTHLVAQALPGAATGVAPLVGLLAAMAAGVAFSLIHALVSVTFRVDQIISGVALNLLAVGLARLLNILFFGVATQSPGIHGFAPVSIPGLRDVPALAPIATGISPVILAALGLVIVGQWVLLRTVFGLRLRAVGEHPAAADTLGINVVRMRYAGVLISGALAGLAGGYLSIEQGRGYLEGMTQGRGFIALAAMIFGNWWPLGALGASALFGYFEALSLRVVHTVIPYQFITVLPHMASILVLAGFVRRATPPAADGIPYSKEEG